MSAKTIHLKLAFMTIIWGVTPTAGRFLAHYESPGLLTFGRFVFASLILYLLLRTGRRSGSKVQLRHVPGFVLLGLTGICLHNVLMFWGVEYTQANRASVIMGVISIMVAVLDYIFFRIKLGRTAILGVLLGLFGIAMVVSDGRFETLWSQPLGFGDSLLFGSALAWAVYSVAGRPLLREFTPLEVTCYASIAGTIFLLPFVVADPVTALRMASDVTTVVLIAFLGAIGSGIGYLWYYEGVEGVGSVNTAIYVNLIPVTGVVIAALALGEVPSLALMSGAGIVVSGLILVNR